MKKNIYILFMVLFSTFILTSCVNTVSIPDGKWVSDSPKMYFETHVLLTTKITGAVRYGAIGELVNDNGDVTRIMFHYAPGGFTIYKYYEDRPPGMEDEIFKGTYIIDGDILTLTTTDGVEIVLRKVANAT